MSEELKVSFNRLQEEYIYEKSEKEKEIEEVESNHRCEVEEMHDKYKEEMDKCKFIICTLNTIFDLVFNISY